MALNTLGAVRHQPWSGGFEITRDDLRTGGCPRCRGALQLCRDVAGCYRKCLNCSRETPAETPDRRAGPPTGTPRTGVALTKV